jgi:hypothetical protein
MTILVKFPLIVVLALGLFAAPCWAAQLINVTGNGVVMQYVSVDCAGANEIGIAVSGTTFTGNNISVHNCAGG